MTSTVCDIAVDVISEGQWHDNLVAYFILGTWDGAVGVMVKEWQPPAPGTLTRLGSRLGRNSGCCSSRVACKLQAPHRIRRQRQNQMEHASVHMAEGELRWS